MSTETITLQVESEVARIFEGASGEEREKLQVLLGVWVKEFVKSDSASLKQTMDELSERARSRGLTPETLDSILEAE
jgi:hypothetical protein